MDTQTLQAYDSDAARFAQEWNEQAAPADMYDLLLRYFRQGPTADIGCGSGRDLAWLLVHGYEARGFDASEALLGQARLMYPALDFTLAELPELKGVEQNFYENVLCETVIMHLEPQAIGAAVRSLFRLLRSGGTLYLSWRVTEHASQRDQLGRLYSAFGKTEVVDALGKEAAILFDSEDLSLSSGKRVHRLIVRKAGRTT
ncbi:MAG: class I SAM-dependent methyltransferase [Pseudomonadota bacterium]